MKNLQEKRIVNAQRKHYGKTGESIWGVSMNRLLCISLLTLSLTMGVVLAEGGSSGSGGDALVCRDKASGKIVSASVWDYAEGEIEQGTEVDLGMVDLPWNEKVEIWLGRVAMFDSHVHYYLNWAYEEMFKNFETESKPVRLISPSYNGERVELRDIDDANQGIMFGDDALCSLRQIARQEKSIRSFEAFIKIDPLYWNMMDNNSKAGLVIHEILLYYYNQIIVSEEKKDTTEDIRYFNRVIANNTLFGADLEQYLFLLDDAKFVHMGAPHFYSWSDADSGEQREVKSLRFFHLDWDLRLKRIGREMRILAGRTYVDFSIQLNGTEIEIAKDSVVQFHDDGANGVKEADLKNDVVVNFYSSSFFYERNNLRLSISAENVWHESFKCGFITLSSAGGFTSGCLAEDVEVQFFSGNKHTFAKNSLIEFNDDGSFKRGCIVREGEPDSNIYNRCQVVTAEDIDILDRL